MQDAARLGQRDAVATAVQQRETKPGFQPTHGREHGRMGSSQPRRGGLEAAHAHHGIEAAQIMKFEPVEIVVDIYSHFATIVIF